MNQDINFYTREFRPRFNWLSLNLSLGYCGVLILVLMVVSLLEVFGQRQVMSALSEIERENQEWQSKIAGLQAIITERAKDPALEQRLAELEGFQKDKLSLQKFLNEGLSGNVDGFSAHFSDLARYHIEGLRLTGVDLRQGGQTLRLDGEVLSGELVTRYIAALGQSENFVGKSFTNLEMSLIGTSSEGEAGVNLGRGLLRFTVETEQEAKGER